MVVSDTNLGRNMMHRYEVYMFHRTLYEIENWSEVLPGLEIAP